jgi:hypothetical protein
MRFFVEPITVAAYIETLQRQAAPPTVKQHMAAIRMMFSRLTEKVVLAMNPAREAKTEKFSRIRMGSSVHFGRAAQERKRHPASIFTRIIVSSQDDRPFALRALIFFKKFVAIYLFVARAAGADTLAATMRLLRQMTLAAA